jgi:uncharacterized membrane protein YphA (DoxX/SURF4 family)
MLGGWVAGLTTAAGGAVLLIGFLTPIASIVAGLGSAAIGLSWASPSADLFDARLWMVLLLTMSVSVLLVGPGAFSLDARLFGRREIIIPQPSRSSKY